MLGTRWAYRSSLRPYSQSIFYSGSSYTSSVVVVHAMRTIRNGPGNDCTRTGIKSIYDSPVLDLLFRGAQVRRYAPSLKEVQQCPLLSLKIGVFGEDCSYCPLPDSDTSVKPKPTFAIFSLFPPPATRYSHLNCRIPGTRFLSTSLSEGLEGLIDPTNQNLIIGAAAGVEFEFLHNSLSRPKDSAGLNLNPGTCSNEVAAIASVIRDTNDGFGDRTQKYLRLYREKLCEGFVVEVLGALRDTDLGVKFFVWAGRQIGYVHTAAVYNALLEVMGCGEKNVRVADSILREIKDEDRQVLGILLNLLVRKCYRGGMWNLALEELGRLKDYGYRPTQATYNALVQVFLQADKFDMAKLVHREMSGAGFYMDAHNLGCFVYSLCKSGNWRDALELIEREEYAPLSKTVVYTQMICGLCESSLFDEAFNILDRILDRMRSSSWIPNVKTYSILLCGCLRKRQLGRCKRILSMMIAEGCYPSRETFNLLVSAFCTSGDHSYAKKLFKKMVKCGHRPGYVVYNILIGSICSNKEVLSSNLLELAEEAYCEMLGAGVVLNKVNVCSFARCLCGAGKFEAAQKIIQEMMQKGFKPDSSTYTEVISFLANSLKVEKAFSLFKEMKNNGIVPDVYTYTVMIDSFCKVGLIDQGETLFNEMVRLGCPPNVVTYTALIHACLKSGKISRANELFELMQSEGITPNIVTYTALIDGHCKAGKTETACQIYSRMRGNGDLSSIDLYFKLSDDDAKEPNVFTYGALVDGLCKSHNVEGAHDLLDAMEVAGCEPNHIVHDALIDGFCKAGQIDEALKVFNKMSRRGIGPNVHTYSSFIDRSFKEGRPDQAMKFVSRMLENSCTPNVVIYTSMIDGLCKDGKTDLAYRLMLLMEQEGCPNVITYTAMIDGFGKAGEVKKSIELLKQMSYKGCSPNFVTYVVLIRHCCSAGLLDDAYMLLNEMKLTYWPRHPTGYRKVIEGFSRQFIASLGLVDEMAEMDSVPLVPFYCVVIDNFVKAGRLELALDLHEEIISSSPVSPDYWNTYASLIESLSLATKVDKAFELYVDSTRRGMIPELTSFVHLVRGLVRSSKWEEALMLSDSLCQMACLSSLAS